MVLGVRCDVDIFKLTACAQTIEMDRMSKFTYARMRIRMRIPAHEAPTVRIHMRIPVSRYPLMQTRMRIFVTYLKNTSSCQIGAAFVTEYRLLHYNDYTEY